MTAVTLQAAFVLHHRPFRDTSVIADLLTPDFGRVSVVARGARSAKSNRRALLQPFRPVLASWTGRSNLRTLGTMEESGMPMVLTGKSLACAYYATELALCLIQEGEPNAIAFALYARTLSMLQDESALDTTLRLFELGLLDSIGVLPDFAHCDLEQGAINAEGDYFFDPESGCASLSESEHQNTVMVSGKTLLAMASQNLTDTDVLLQAKRLMRRIVQVQLGGRPLKSRDVFAQLGQVSAKRTS